jgi:hypothetical protein
LAGKDPSAHQKEFLRLSHDNSQKAVVIAKMVRGSRRPQVELTKYESSLRAHPALLANLALEIFAQTGDVKFAEKILRNGKLASEPAGRVLAREIYLREFQVVVQKLARHHLKTTGDAQIQASLKERLNLLSVVEKTANTAISRHDWVSQIVALSVVARENQRVYEDVIALPIPKKLKGEQRHQYQMMVESNARVYSQKHDKIEQKLAGLWADDGVQSQMDRDARSAQPSVRRLLETQMKKVADVAPSEKRSSWTESIKAVSAMPTERQVADARRELIEKPFNVPSIEKLREIEQERGRETMVAYLDARRMKMSNGGQQ